MFSNAIIIMRGIKLLSPVWNNSTASSALGWVPRRVTKDIGAWASKVGWELAWDGVEVGRADKLALVMEGGLQFFLLKNVIATEIQA